MLSLDFIGLGVFRSGTRWLCSALRSHPQLFVPEHELNFFINRRILSCNSLGEAYLEKIFKPAQPFQKKGEISPVYFTSPESLHLITSRYPDIKNFVILRSQHEVLQGAYSLFLQANPKINKSYYTFHDFLTWQPQLLENLFYLDHIERFLKVVKMTNFKVLMYDDLITNPSGFLQSVYDFLCVDRSFNSPLSSIRVNESSLKDKNDLFMKINNPLNQSGKHFLIDVIHDIYHEHNNNLGLYLGRNLSHWNCMETTT
jgi:hypothetical protein